VDVLLAGPGAVRAGAVIPKRWARRSVTRSLLKRQVFAAFERHLDHLPSGMWVVRLRSSFETAQFPSAASQALRLAARSELDRLFGQAAQRWAQARRSARH
jgi:ribonuclease P protein component